MAVTSDELEQGEKWLLKQLSKGARRPSPLVIQGVEFGLNPTALYEVAQRSDRIIITKWRKDVWWEIAENDRI